jgi:uncharacterized protein YbjT (DUF2867 family)
MKIVILGGTGQIGSEITSFVLQEFKDAQVLSCSRKGGDLAHQVAFNVNQEDWSALGKIDVLINAVGIIEEKGENTFHKAHVGVVEKIISQREKMGDPTVIHISVLGANKNSPSKYASTKGVADDLLMQQKKWNIIRPSFVCTPGTAIIQKIEMLHRMSKFQFGFLPIPAHFLSARFQPVMVADICESIKVIINEGLNKELIYATGPEVYGLRDWIEIKGKGKIKIIPIPKWIIDPPFRLIIKLFPQIMNTDQYLLLGENNTHNFEKLKSVIKREPKSTQNFWKTELK